MGFKEYAHRNKHNQTLEGWALKGDNLVKGLNKWNLKGAQAVLDDTGQTNPRVSFGRVAAGGILFGPAGAIVGAVAKKDPSRVYIHIQLANGTTKEIAVPAKHHAKAHKFTAAINKIANRA